MTTNPFEFICADCASPWKVGSAFCWNCGSANFADNPAFQVPIEKRPALPRHSENTYEAPGPMGDMAYLLYTLSIGGFIGIATYFSLRDTEELAWLYGTVVALVVSGNVWLVCLIIMTKSRVDQVNQSLAEVLRRLPR